MDSLKLQNFNLQRTQNHAQHNTYGLKSDALVVRRGQPFDILLVFSGPFRAIRDGLKLRINLDTHNYDFPITSSRNFSFDKWSAYIKHSNDFEPCKVLISVVSPATANIGQYELKLLFKFSNKESCNSLGCFTLLCNPWCHADSVYLGDEHQREEYVRNDFGMLYKGTADSISFRPWGFDQYENGILECCMLMLQMSPQHKKNKWRDYEKRASPVYISRIVSAMINCDDDCGVLLGSWSEYSDGVNPSDWTGSGEILRQWANSGCAPVKYGQCWVFAAVMCTVMRVLGIPTRVVTNYNSAHDTNANLVIEEFYNENGEKLMRNRDSIWNFHVWVECWMTRDDLGPGFDGWQVLDPTPQERSEGMFRCGPAPVIAIRECRTDLAYDIPFIYAEVNAKVLVFIVREEKVLGYSTNTERVGTLICTKSIGSSKPQDITFTYKVPEPSPRSIYSTHQLSDRSRSSASEISAISRYSTLPSSPRFRQPNRGLDVILTLCNVPVVGKSILFSLTVTNKDPIPKQLKEHVNAQKKRYNRCPSSTFWKSQNTFLLAPHESKVIPYEIFYSQYEFLGNNRLVNLAAVITDMATQEKTLAFEEFNINSPAIKIQVADEGAIIAFSPHVAMVMFTSPFPMIVSGVLTVAGSGLLEHNEIYNIPHLNPGQTLKMKVFFTPRMPGMKMLRATLKFFNNSTVVHGFKTITVFQPNSYRTVFT